MDLKHYLPKVFPNKGSEKYSFMLDELSSWGVNSTSDLKYVSEETFKEAKCFTPVEAMKLIDYYKNPENLENVLMEIFVGSRDERLMEIENIFIKYEMFARKDVLVIDTIKLSEASLLSEAEIQKIELYLEKNNKDHYNKIMLEKKTKSDLRDVILEIFQGSPITTIDQIEELFKKIEITSKKDVLHINTNKLKKTQLLSEARISKIDRFLREKNHRQYAINMEENRLENYDPENLQDVLKKVFALTPDTRMKKIEEILHKEEVYTGRDILLISIKRFRSEKFLSESEITKIEEYIRENHADKYDEIQKYKKMKQKEELMEVELRMKIKQQYGISLVQERDLLIKEIQELGVKHDVLIDLANKKTQFLGIEFQKSDKAKKAILQGPAADKLTEIFKERMGRLEKLDRQMERMIVYDAPSNENSKDKAENSLKIV